MVFSTHPLACAKVYNVVKEKAAKIKREEVKV